MLLFLFFIKRIDLAEDKEKTEAIKRDFKLAWDGYKRCAFGSDFLKPISCQPHHWLNASLSIVDSLDTLSIMGFNEDLEEAIQFLENGFKFNASGSFFELIIRVIGGLCSAYQLTKRESLLLIADEFATRLLPAFDTPTHLPKPNIDIGNMRASTWGYAPRSTFLAHAGSLSPEFMTLAMHTEKEIYRNISDNVMCFLFNAKAFHGLWPHRIDFATGVFANVDIGFDAYGDSFYEYLLKLYIMTDGKCKSCGSHYKRCIQGMKDFLMRNTTEYLYIGTINDQKASDSLTHLSYFVPGMIALGSQYFNESDLKFAEELADTIAKWHFSTKTGLSPEAFSIEAGAFKIKDKSYKLRPEFIESCFYLYRLTGNEKWREIGWKIYSSIVKYCKVGNGFAELLDVNGVVVGHKDVQDSYFLAETFKYAFLLFSNSDTLPIDEYVFTTEGHILKHFDKQWIEENYNNSEWFTNEIDDEGPYKPSNDGE